MCMPEHTKGRNHRENLVATSAMVDRICPPGEDRVKVSENLGATAVAPVAPVDTSLNYVRGICFYILHYVQNLASSVLV